jgi:acetyl esterase/lipase
MRMRTRATAVLATLLTAPAALSAQLEITPDVVYGHKDGLALTYDVVRPTTGANGAAVIYMVSGGWVSRWRPPEAVATRDLFAELTARGFTLYFVRHGSSPRFKVPAAIADVRLAVAHIREHAPEHGVDPPSGCERRATERRRTAVGAVAAIRSRRSWRTSHRWT